MAGGKPGRPASNRRSLGGKAVLVRLSSDEFELLEQAASADGVKVVEFMRAAALWRARARGF